MRSLCSLLCALMLGLPPRLAAGEQRGGPAVQVTSDTIEFCDMLARHFAREQQSRPRVAPERVVLAGEGRRLCAMGLIRAGIARLRMALRP